MARRVVVLPNRKNPGPGTLMALPPDMPTFLRVAGDKLGVMAKKAYTEEGNTISDVSIIRDDERVYISSGEAFWKNDEGRVRVYKIAVLGAGGVGKSCLSMRYVKNAFVDIYDPTIEDAFRHHVVIDNQPCMLDILDTAGQEDMRMLRRQWVSDRDGFVLVYSMVDRRSFEELNSFLGLIKSMKTNYVPMVIVANKADMRDQRTVSVAEAEALARANNAQYIEASARAGLNVAETFELLVRSWPADKSRPTGGGSKRPGCTIL